MKKRLKKYTYKIFILSILFLLMGCSGSSKEIKEDDGIELVSLMNNVHEALENEDAALFESTFAKHSAPEARSIWKRFLKRKASGDNGQIIQLITYPELERATTTVHVNRLILDAWFDLGNKNNIYKTSWEFIREQSDSQWKIGNIRIDKVSGSIYGILLTDLNKMFQSSFLALDMNWEESINPAPLLTETFNALVNEDIEALKTYTVDGTLFSAFRKGIEMPTIENDDTVSGRYNRDQSLSFLEEQIQNIKQSSKDLGVSPDQLMPYFNAYSITSIPDYCTKLRLFIEFDDKHISKDIKRFAVAWSAARLHERWLIESMLIKSIAIYE
jgi:hypothetical protein